MAPALLLQIQNIWSPAEIILPRDMSPAIRIVLAAANALDSLLVHTQRAEADSFEPARHIARMPPVVKRGSIHQHSADIPLPAAHEEVLVFTEPQRLVEQADGLENTAPPQRRAQVDKAVGLGEKVDRAIRPGCEILNVSLRKTGLRRAEESLDRGIESE